MNLKFRRIGDPGRRCTAIVLTIKARSREAPSLAQLQHEAMSEACEEVGIPRQEAARLWMLTSRDTLCVGHIANTTAGRDVRRSNRVTKLVNSRNAFWIDERKSSAGRNGYERPALL